MNQRLTQSLSRKHQRSTHHHIHHSCPRNDGPSRSNTLRTIWSRSFSLRWKWSILIGSHRSSVHIISGNTAGMGVLVLVRFLPTEDQKSGLHIRVLLPEDCSIFGFTGCRNTMQLISLTTPIAGPHNVIRPYCPLRNVEIRYHCRESSRSGKFESYLAQFGILEKANTIILHIQSLSAGIEDVLLDLVTGKVYYGQLRPEEGKDDS